MNAATPPRPFRLAMVQMRVDGGEPEVNLSRAEARLAEAKAKGADIAVLPETLDLGWTHPSALSGADAIPDGAACQRLRNAARRHGLLVAAGLTERSGDRVFNSAVLVDA
ncbi:MAG: hypothetical protein KDM81_10905, partial [Verrucomicrobiae bacterium]|nr:hypothetical protein [Verrucomicrobiae bacterium]